MKYNILKLSTIHGEKDFNSEPSAVIIDSICTERSLAQVIKNKATNGTIRAIGIINNDFFTNVDIEYIASCGVFIFTSKSIDECYKIINEYSESRDLLKFADKALSKEYFIHAIVSGNPT